MIMRVINFMTSSPLNSRISIAHWDEVGNDQRGKVLVCVAFRNIGFTVDHPFEV